ncbi:MAG: DUF302 domain-containing protein [Dehalococcoidia bacterium]
MEQSAYSLAVTTPLGFEEAVAATIAALRAEGFGVLTEIDVKATLKQKLDVDFRPYLILGACNPRLAYRGLQAEEDLGLLLPCNVVVSETGHGARVAVMDPALMASITENEALEDIAAEARGAMERVLAAVESS